MRRSKQANAKVYRVPADSRIKSMTESMCNVLEHRDFKLLRSFWERDLVGIKITCPFRDKEQQLMAGFIRAVGESAGKSELRAFICDTSNRHRNSFSSALDQIGEAYCDCFEELHRLLPFFTLDGITGDYEYTDKINGDEIFLGGEIVNLDGLLAVTLPFEHRLCGIAGALYGIGTGLASRRGKIRQRTQNKPQVDASKCYSCRRCLHGCPVRAISLGPRHVVIDEKRCVDCGKCVEIAKRCGISYDWNATPEYFRARMLEHAAGAIKVLGTHMIFIVILPSPQGPGKTELLISRDPVAVDAAMLALARESGGFAVTLLDEAEKQLDCAVSLGVGSAEYQLVEVAY